MITRHELAAKLTAYLTHELSRDQLKDWAVRAIRDGDLDLPDVDLLMDILSRIGLANIEHFELSWEDYEDFLSRLGYQVHLQVSPAS